MSEQLFNYDQLIVSLIAKAARKNGQLLEFELEGQEMSLQEFRILGLLVGEPACNQKTLAKKLSVRPATLSVAISKLEEKGLIKRMQSPGDKRVNYLKLSEDLDFKKANSVMKEVEKRITFGIKKKELEITKRVLQQVIANFDNEI